jgi:hypothetical protein
MPRSKTHIKTINIRANEVGYVKFVNAYGKYEGYTFLRIPSSENRAAEV